MRFALLALVACGNGSSARTKSDAPADTHVIDARVDAHPDAPADAKIFMDAPPDAKIFMDAPPKVFLDAPPGTYPLKVKNYSFWCAVEVNNSGTFSTALEQDVNVLPGAIALVAKPANSTFELGTDMWHYVDGTTGDTGVPGTQAGTGTSATSTTQITIVASGKCVWVCCPFSADGSGCNPAIIGDQCP
jgi:hypothetical protein